MSYVFFPKGFLHPPPLPLPQIIINLHKYYISFHSLLINLYVNIKNIFSFLMYLLLWNLSSFKYTKITCSSFLPVLSALRDTRSY